MTSSSADCLSSPVNDEERPAIYEAIQTAVSHSVHSHTVDEQSSKRKANQSEVWDHFQKLEKVEGQKQKAVCNHCGQIFICDSNSNGTSSMKTHIKLICRQYEFSQFNLNKNPGKRQKTLAFESVNGGGTDTVPKLTAVSFSVEACRKALAEMIILDELPFRFVEGQSFKRFIYVVQPKWENPPAFERLEDEDNLSLNVGVREDEIGVESVDNKLEGEVHGGLIDIMNFEKQHERGQGKGRGKHVTHGTPSSDDWNVVEMYIEVLKVFYILTEKFLGSLYVTCNTFFKEIMTMKTAFVKLENSDNPKLKVLASGMNKKYDKYWGKFDKINSLLLYANVLDPRYKFVYVRWSLNKHYEKSVVEKKVIEIQEGMLKLFNWYEKKSVEHGKTQNVGESSKSAKNSKE
ncbi:hypothetical protein RHMOL_Rhmol10G0213500 [Rhododendron molle]|uniref:Uncharacterized protein n=1 Tax=Rhododendron molle TaxID=49168 RepID=A0ACC0M4R2_RHOML|nr:hypothetical protein RHMOL_Rhmol10G0213500 [Rhododendron molle]